MEMKSSKEYSIVFLVEGEIQVTKFAFYFIFSAVNSVSDSVHTSLEFAAFGRRPTADLMSKLLIEKYKEQGKGHQEKGGYLV